MLILCYARKYNKVQLNLRVCFDQTLSRVCGLKFIFESAFEYVSFTLLLMGFGNGIQVIHFIFARSGLLMVILPGSQLHPTIQCLVEEFIHGVFDKILSCSQVNTQ